MSTKRVVLVSVNNIVIADPTWLEEQTKAQDEPTQDLKGESHDQTSQSN